MFSRVQPDDDSNLSQDLSCLAADLVLGERGCWHFSHRSVVQRRLNSESLEGLCEFVP